MRCPRCHLTLVAQTIHHANAYTCRRCGGVWLDRDASKLITSVLASRLLLVAEKVDARAVSSPWRKTSIACPACGAVLARKTVKQAAVEIDECDEHGTFYDRHELARVIRSVQRERIQEGAVALTGAATAGAAAASQPTGGSPSSADALSAAVDAAALCADAVEIAADVADAVDASGAAVSLLSFLGDLVNLAAQSAITQTSYSA